MVTIYYMKEYILNQQRAKIHGISPGETMCKFPGLPSQWDPMEICLILPAMCDMCKLLPTGEAHSSLGVQSFTEGQ